jgi:hypothetical protein
MAFNPVENRLGIQPIAVPLAQTTLYQTGQTTSFYAGQHRIGEIVRAADPTFGGGEFIYLMGVANTVVGSLVTYNPATGATTLSPATTGSNTPQSVAVAMSACVSGYYGWYQIEGAAVIKKTAVKFNPVAAAIYLSGTAGRIQQAQAASAQIWNAVTINAATVASATSTITISINRPFIQGRAT